MNADELLQLVLDATNTNDYDDEADGWLTTKITGGVLEVQFEHSGKPEVSCASWELREVTSGG